MDKHLEALRSPATRRHFLKKQVEAWQVRYSKFIATKGASEPVSDPTDPPSAADFLLTITGLKARQDAMAS